MAALWALGSGACFSSPQPGYNPKHPSEVICGCHDPDTCYQGASDLASSRGENAETGEELLYFAQCACFEGSRAGCNTLAHFTKDWVRACESGTDPANSCTIAGFVYEHGVRVPNGAGRSFDRDPAAAASAFKQACDAGSRIACMRQSSK